MKKIAICIDFKGTELSSYSRTLLGFADTFFGSEVAYYLFSFAGPKQASIPHLKGSVIGFQVNAGNSLFADTTELRKLGDQISALSIDEIWLSKSNTSDSLAGIFQPH